MQKFDSSLIASADYDAASERLTVEFTSGSVYTYDKVPMETYDAFQRAKSVGSFFNSYIRPHFAAAKQEPEESGA